MKTKPNGLATATNLKDVLTAVGKFPRPELIFGLSDREVVDWINFQLTRMKSPFRMARSTFSQWRKEWAEEGDESIYLQNNPEVLAFVSFLAELEINAKMEILGKLWDARGHVEAEKMKWFLERRWKDEFAEADKQAATVNITGITLNYNAGNIDVPLITTEQEMLELDAGQQQTNKKKFADADDAYVEFDEDDYDTE